MRPSVFAAAALITTLLASTPLVHAAEAGERPPIGAFFENPAFSGAMLSPSGKYLAVRLGLKGQRQRLAVVTLGTNAVQTVAFFNDADIEHFRWVNDERLVFTATDNSAGAVDDSFGPGMYAINRDGEKFIQLVSRSGKPVVTGTSIRNDYMLPWDTYLMNELGAQNSEFIYVRLAEFTQKGQLHRIKLLKLNTITGRWTPVAGPERSIDWLLDDQGEPRVATTVTGDVTAIQYRDPATDKWRELINYPTYTGSNSAVSPKAIGPDGTLYVVAYAGQDTSALYAYDFATNSIAGQPMVKLDGYDFSGHLLIAKNKLLGVRYLTDATDTSWLDPQMKTMQAKIDARLPHTINLLTLPKQAQAPWVLIHAYSDRFPRRTMLYNSDTDVLSDFGTSQPDIKPEQMGTQTAVRYKARDGLSIPALLTLPKGQSKNLPLVVLVHGGPYLRGNSWGWDADGQFLASRGYAVLEPEFRGSTGFGAKHFRAGWKQWGLAMQDDIADAARWAIAQGTVDPKRICIAGASYGGYATLMGLIKDPDLFKCGINWVGVTDINMMYESLWSFRSDLPDGWKQYGMPYLIGDRVKDAEQLKATSPLLRAAEIKQPLLLAYGGADKRVPLPHGTRFYKAIKSTNPAVEWVEYPEEGHGWKLPKNRIDFWQRVERFLDKNIGPQAAH